MVLFLSVFYERVLVNQNIMLWLHFKCFGMLGKIFRGRQFDFFFLFSEKTGFNISFKLSSLDWRQMCMKCQDLFSGKNKYFKMSSADSIPQHAKFKIFLQLTTDKYQI